MITFLKAPPFATVQDLGREGYRAVGVPPSGAMDRWSLSLGNLLVGNPTRASAVEWALGGGRLRFEVASVFALTGARTHATLNGIPVAMDRTQRARAGGVLELGPLGPGRFLYLAVAGNIAVPEVLRSQATYLPGGFGGHEGRRLRTGDRLPYGTPIEPAPPTGFALPGPTLTARTGALIRLVQGPQADQFGGDAWQRLLNSTYRVSHASDRMGYRLEGLSLRPRVPAAHPSEPTCVGALQVPDGGTPIVLMPDGPTVGGYPKPAVVIAVDADRLAQHRPGEEVRFQLVSVADAEAEYRRGAEMLEVLRERARATARDER